MIWLGILLSIYVSILMVTKNSKKEINSNWIEYQNEISGVDIYAGKLAKQFIGTNLSQTRDLGNVGKLIEQHLKNSRSFATSIEVFLSVVIAYSVIGISVILVALSANIQDGVLALFIFIGIAISYYPWNKLFTNSKKRIKDINEALPDFIDLLVMVLPTTSPIPALSFTAERSNGPVADEIRNLVRTVSSRGSSSDLESFTLAGDRLASPEARAFMTTLQNAYIEGVPAVETLKQQSESLRRLFYQSKRAEAKKLPTKLIIIFAIHFLPLLIILAMLPVIVGMGTGL